MCQTNLVSSRFALAAVLLILGAVATSFGQETQATRAVVIPGAIPYTEGAYIADNIKAECNLPGYQSTALADALRRRGYQPLFTENASIPAGAEVLKLEISSAFSSGNAFTGHKKGMSVSGKLFRNDEQLGSFVAFRRSMGGFLGGFKGSCTVLQRCADEIADDVAEWLASPSANAKLGDAP